MQGETSPTFKDDISEPTGMAWPNPTRIMARLSTGNAIPKVIRQRLHLGKQTRVSTRGARAGPREREDTGTSTCQSVEFFAL
jgi:hypothetical protein